MSRPSHLRQRANKRPKPNRHLRIELLERRYAPSTVMAVLDRFDAQPLAN